MLARSIPLFLVLILAACGTPVPSQEVASPTGRIDRVVVAPMNLALRMPAELDGTEAPVWDTLLQHFQAHDRVVRQIDAADAQALWTEVVIEMGDAKNLDGATREFAHRLAEQTEFDLLVMPALVMRSARVRGTTVYWDGVRRKLDRAWETKQTIGAFGSPGSGSMSTGLTGKVAGASLYVSIVTPEGEPVFAGLGGLDLLHEIERPESDAGEPWQVVLREAPFAETDHLREGVALALERRLRRTASAW